MTVYPIRLSRGRGLTALLPVGDTAGQRDRSVLRVLVTAVRDAQGRAGVFPRPEFRMRRLNLIAALLLAAAASACAPNPIIARDPVPAPGPADVVACESRPLPVNAFITGCRPVPASPQVVVRARG